MNIILSLFLLVVVAMLFRIVNTPIPLDIHHTCPDGYHSVVIPEENGMQILCDKTEATR